MSIFNNEINEIPLSLCNRQDSFNISPCRNRSAIKYLPDPYISFPVIRAQGLLQFYNIIELSIHIGNDNSSEFMQHSEEQWYVVYTAR